MIIDIKNHYESCLFMNHDGRRMVSEWHTAAGLQQGQCWLIRAMATIAVQGDTNDGRAW